MSKSGFASLIAKRMQSYPIKFGPALFVALALATCSPNSPKTDSADSCKSVQSVLITNAPPDSLQLDDFDLDTIAINDDILRIEITHGGGCKPHTYALYMSPAVFLESFPAQANLYLQHNANGDVCKALLHPTVCFDLRSLAALYQKFYQHIAPIRLNVYGYGKGQPQEKLSLLYVP